MTRRNARLTLCAAAALLLTAHPALATKYAGEFMKIPIGARAIGMGGAFSAVTDDATASPCVCCDHEGCLREQVLAPGTQLGSTLGIQAHDVGAGGTDAARERVPPVIEARMLQADRQR